MVADPTQRVSGLDMVRKMQDAVQKAATVHQAAQEAAKALAMSPATPAALSSPPGASQGLTGLSGARR